MKINLLSYVFGILSTVLAGIISMYAKKYLSGEWQRQRMERMRQERKEMIYDYLLDKGFKPTKIIRIKLFSHKPKLQTEEVYKLLMELQNEGRLEYKRVNPNDDDVLWRVII